MAWRVLLVRMPSSTDQDNNEMETHIETGASALLFLSSIPRAGKGLIPAILAVTSAGTGFYYGKTVYNLRA